MTGTGLDHTAQTIVPVPDGSVYLLGNFTKYKGVSVPKIIRLLGNGSIDNNFSFTGSGLPVMYLLIKKATLAADNKLVVIGDGFDSSKPSRGAFCFRLDLNGSYDTTLPAFTNGNGYMYDVLTYPNGDFMVGGNYYGIKDSHALLKCSSTGVKVTGFASHNFESPGTVNKTLVDAEERILIAGPFHFINHSPVAGIARVNPDGSLDNTFTSPLSGMHNQWIGVNGELLLDSNKKILVGGGLFYLKDGSKKRSVLRLNENGTVDNTFTVSRETCMFEDYPFRVSSLINFNGKILIGGQDVYSNKNIYLLDQTGALATGFTQGQVLGFDVTAAAIQNSNQLLLGGSESSSLAKMVRMSESGVIDPSFQLEQQFRSIRVIKILADGKAYVGGTSNFIPMIRIHPNGAVDNSFKLQKSGSYTVYDILLQEGKGIFVAADKLISAHYPDGTLNTHFAVAAGSSDNVWMNITTLSLKDTTLYAGGYFNSMGGVAKTSLAKIIFNPAPVEAPAVFSAQVINSRSARLSWENEDETKKVVIERALKHEGPYASIGTFDKSKLTFDDNHLQSSTTYHYRARFENYSGSGPASEVKAITTPENPLNAPNRLNAELKDYVNVTLSWNGSFTDVRSMELEMFEDTLSNPVKINFVSGSPVKLTLKENSRFYFRVRANYGSNGTSDPSPWVMVKTEIIPFYQPYNFTANVADYRKAVLQWEDSSLVTTTYKLFKSGSYSHYSFGEREIATFDGGLRTFEDREVEAGFTYTYRLQAISKSGNTINSQSINVVIPNYLYGAWGVKSSLATGRAGAVGFSVMGKGYIGLGFNGSRLADFWEYNPATNSWVSKAAYPGGTRNEAIAFVIGGKAYVGTGRSDNGTEKDFYEFDPLNNSWKKLADFPSDHAGNSGLAGGVAFVIDGKGYVSLGGRNGVVNTDLWAYDPELNTWTKKASYPGKATEGAVSWAEKGIGYVAFGGVMSLSKELWKYNPVMDSWSNANAYLSESERTESVAGFLAGKAIVTTGNTSGNIFSKSLTDQTLYYSNVYNAWLYIWGYRFTGPLRNNAVSFTIGNRMYVATGSSSTSAYLSDLWVLEPSIKTPPATPHNLAFKPLTETSGWLLWNLAQDNEEGIIIEMANSEASPFNQIAVVGPGVNKLKLENLTNGNIYNVRIKAYNSDASSAYENLQFKMILPPSAPGLLAANLTSANKVSLNWQDGATNETGFKIWRKKAAASDSTILVDLPANATEYLDETVAENTGYTYYVIAVNEGGPSAKSNAATITTGYNPPMVPVQVEVVGLSASAISLSWKIEGSSTGTEVWVKAGESGSYSLASTLNSGVSNYSIQSPVPDQVYYIKLRSKNSTLLSEYSAEVFQRMPPKAPLLREVVYAELEKVRIKWDDISMVEDGYIVFCQKEGGSWIALDTLAPASTAYIHTIPEKGVNYKYKVVAFNSSGKSADSNQEGVFIYSVTPSEPLITTVVKVSAGFQVNWEVNALHNNGVVLEYKILGSDFIVADTFEIKTLSTVFVLQGKTDWLYFRARSINLEGYSAYSGEVSIEVTTKPLAPTNLALLRPNTDKVKLQWVDKAANEDGYVIEYYYNEGSFQTADTVAANTTSYLLNLHEKEGTLTARVTAFNIAGAASSSEEGISMLLSVGDPGQDEYLIFPNPTNSLLNVEGKCLSFKLYNNQGRIVMEKAYGETSEERKVIDLSAYPAGIYYLEVRSGHKVVRKPIIKL